MKLMKLKKLSSLSSYQVCKFRIAVLCPVILGKPSGKPISEGKFTPRSPDLSWTCRGNNSDYFILSINFVVQPASGLGTLFVSSVS
jgi:hypothetical protein